MSCTSEENSFNQKYIMESFIAKGSFGHVYAGHRISDKLHVAIKYIKKFYISNWEFLNARKLPLEIILLLKLQNVEGVIQLQDFYETLNYFIIVMDKPEHSQDLCDFIYFNGNVSEKIACKILLQIVKAIFNCKENGVLYRDLKAENVLVNLENLSIVLIDFGASCFSSNDILNVDCLQHTIAYSPPEFLIHDLYDDDSVLVWSLGIIMYLMVFGDVPYETKEDVLNNELNWFYKSSIECVEFIKKMLAKDACERISLEMVCNDKWLNQDK